MKKLEEEYARLKLQTDVDGNVKQEGAAGGVIQTADLSSIDKSLQMITNRLGILETHIQKHPSTTGGGTTDPTTSTTATAAAANLIAAPLTKALARLSGDEDEEGMLYRPETYAQSGLRPKNRDHNKLDTIDLFYGWICVAQHVMKSGGNLKSYLDHVRFATEMLHSRNFYDSGAVKYDRLIIDKHLSGKSDNFNPDTVISSLTFSTRVIPDNVEVCHGGSLTKGVVSSQLGGKQTRRRRPNYSPRKQEDVPADFPSDICFFYNYRYCSDETCNRAHICRKCSGKHRADTCKEKSRKS